jgi:hypothetical protein
MAPFLSYFIVRIPHTGRVKVAVYTHQIRLVQETLGKNPQNWYPLSPPCHVRPPIQI